MQKCNNQVHKCKIKVIIHGAPMVHMNRKEIKTPSSLLSPALWGSLGQGRSSSESGSYMKGWDVSSTRSLPLKLHYRKLE